MRISYDPIPIFECYGISTYTSELVRNLAEAYPENIYEFLAYSINRPLYKSTTLQYPNIKCNACLLDPMILGKTFRKPIRNLSDRIRVIKSKKCDLYHCTKPSLFVNAKCPIIMTFYDIIPLFDNNWASGKEKNFFKNNLKECLDRCTWVITISEWSRKDLLTYYPQIENKVSVIPLAASSFYQELNTERSWLKEIGWKEPSRQYFFSVGIFEERKNIVHFLKEYAALPKAYRNEYGIILVGGKNNPKPYQPIEEMLDSLQIRNDVLIAKNVSQNILVKLYNNAYSFVFPSLYEGFGIPVLEAMKCGCPVLSSNTSSLPEVGGDAAIYFDPLIKGELTDRLIKIIDDSGIRASLKRNGFLQAEKFSWKNTALQTAKIYGLK